MRFRILVLLVFITLCSLPLLANAATYNWYFSNNAKGNAVGDDTTGNGSVSHPWKSLSKAQIKINTLGSGDTANLFFDREDTWIVDTTIKKSSHFIVKKPGPIVNIGAYGSGNRPVFDGSVSDFSVADDHNKYSGPLRWNRLFEFQVTNCSISNVEIKNVYGNAIFLNAADGFTLSNSKIHNFGSSAIIDEYQYGIEDCNIEQNVFHTGQQLARYGLRGDSGWEAAVHLTSGGNGSPGLCRNNTTRYNLVYDIFGEGINAPNSIIEYNVVGDTGSIALNISPKDWDALTAVVRYNLVTMSDWSSSNSYPLSGTGPHGIRIYDERVGGDNSAADISVYGNIIINRSNGIFVFSSLDTGNPFGSVKIYNNTIIDSHNLNLLFLNPDEFLAVSIYNNSSILYDRTGSKHAYVTDIGKNWNIDYNHFWTTGGSPNVPSTWRSNYVTTDPKLPGEPVVDWDGLTGTNYFNMIDFGKHLSISLDSNLANAGKILGSGYNSKFLTAGTDFSKFKFQRKSQPNSAKWHIGAIIPNPANYLPPPQVLKIIP